MTAMVTPAGDFNFAAQGEGESKPCRRFAGVSAKNTEELPGQRLSRHDQPSPQSQAAVRFVGNRDNAVHIDERRAVLASTHHSSAQTVDTHPFFSLASF